MKEEIKAIGRPGSSGIPEEGNPGAAEEVIIPDYVMLDFADDFFPDEATNSRLRKPYAPPELFG
jgi:hypothetical protein